MVRGIVLASLIVLPALARAELQDPLDPFSGFSPREQDLEEDSNKSAEELVEEASLLFEDDRPLDARTKLLRALQKDPTEYKAHLLLSGYYMMHVGHFRLALKYVKQAKELFEQKNGPPPYTGLVARNQHGRILYLLSQARLNLDDYHGSLQVLDEYTGYGYHDDWYPGTKAWVLMKLGKVQDAIKEARAGVFAGGEPGRTLNILGILLSMTGERQASLDVFRQAIAYEMALGKEGQPATPLNNSGEVYKEIFNESKAEIAWERAISLPDGCEHVLPSLNLTFLKIDALQPQPAKRQMDAFESCVAQYPLKNGEEHRALVELARGRIAMYGGKIDRALSHLQASIDHRQWFGKIGTSEQDLHAAALISMARAFRQKNNHLQTTVSDGLDDFAKKKLEQLRNSAKAWWYQRRAIQIMVEDLSALEDLYVRNTDSMIEYTTFGEALKTLPPNVLEHKVMGMLKQDDRERARPYYDAYLAENFIANGRRREGLQRLDSVLENAREDFDGGLVLHAMLLKLGQLEQNSEGYLALSQRIFARSRPALRNYGFTLPARIGADMAPSFQGSAFLQIVHPSVENSIVSEYKDGGYRLLFDSPRLRISAEGTSLREAVNKLSDKVFSEDLE